MKGLFLSQVFHEPGWLGLTFCRRLFGRNLQYVEDVGDNSPTLAKDFVGSLRPTNLCRKMRHPVQRPSEGRQMHSVMQRQCPWSTNPIFYTRVENQIQINQFEGKFTTSPPSWQAKIPLVSHNKWDFEILVIQWLYSLGQPSAWTEKSKQVVQVSRVVCCQVINRGWDHLKSHW